MDPDTSNRVRRFLYVFRGKLVEEEREILSSLVNSLKLPIVSDEEELDIRPRTLWPDDDSTDHVSRDEDYDISPFNSQDPLTRLPWTNDSEETNEYTSVLALREKSEDNYATIEENHDTIEDSNDDIEDSNEDIEDNNNTIEVNNGTIELNEETIELNNDAIEHNGGAIEHNGVYIEYSDGTAENNFDSNESSQVLTTTSTNHQPQRKSTRRTKAKADKISHPPLRKSLRRSQRIRGQENSIQDEAQEPGSPQEPCSIDSNEKDSENIIPKQPSRTPEPDCLKLNEDTQNTLPGPPPMAFQPDNLNLEENEDSIIPTSIQHSKAIEPDGLKTENDIQNTIPRTPHETLLPDSLNVESKTDNATSTPRQSSRTIVPDSLRLDDDTENISPMPRRFSKTLEPDSLKEMGDTQNTTPIPRRPSKTLEPDSLKEMDDAQNSTPIPRRPSKTLEPDSLKSTNDAQNTTSDPNIDCKPDSLQMQEEEEEEEKEVENVEDTLISTGESHQSPSVIQEKHSYGRKRSRSETPEYDVYDDQECRQETPEPPDRSLCNDGTNNSPDEISRGYKSETVVKIMDSGELEDEDHTFRSSRSPTPSSDPPSPLTVAIPLRNPFQDVPDTRNEHLISEERENRRMESRDKLAYVLRGHKYGVSPSLYEYNTPSELFGPRVLWPRRSTSPTRGNQRQRPPRQFNHASRNNLPVTPSIYDTDTPTALGTSLTWDYTPSSPLMSMLQQSFESPQSPPHEDEQQQQQPRHREPFYYPYHCPYPSVPPNNGRGGGSSMYGSCDSNTQTQQESNYEEYFATVKNEPIKLSSSEKHARDEDDGEDCQESEVEGHSCESFDACWGTREHCVGVYYWNEERRLPTEARIDKMQVLRRCIEAA
ncbi:hypothetical protein BGZ46_008386 [Entomortierella lignicola]|nr:hypothetical protein BGZ46_008386 [Entomortierella lignicola]